LESTKALFIKKINALLEKEKSESPIVDNLFYIANSFILSKNKDMTDENKTFLLRLYSTLGSEEFISLLDKNETKTIILPSQQDMIESMVLALAMYYKQFKGYTWKEIKDKIDTFFNAISYGIKLQKLDTFINTTVKNYIYNQEGNNE